MYEVKKGSMRVVGNNREQDSEDRRNEERTETAA